MSDRLALIADARLPGDARIIGLYILELGDGWHHVSHDNLRAILDGPSDETLRRHLRKLEGTGWIEAETNTGRRSPKYRIRDADETPSGGFRTPLLASLPHTDVGEKNVSPTLRRGRDPYAPHRRGADGPLVVVEGVGRYPPIVPPMSLDQGVEGFIEDHAETLTGCRGALRDYLRQRVEPPRQRAYVATLLSWLQGGDESVWRKPDGSRIPMEERTPRLATALNELGATDEQASRKNPPGDPRNLRNKLQAIIRSGARRDRPANSGSTATTRGTQGGGRFGESVNAIWRGTDAGGTSGDGGGSEPGADGGGGTAAA